ncbi:uncharacterized protein LOC131525823 isoform X3 [Onychostoma macrolepis]|uniref:Ig-like domain-containing protein n=1 Tax=Onychostoma macrolepis TaxID=369639 RepID=A0A7J6C158_9TELE|nr:uncharacterized protein LOC131525823 isoform X3 [Onychostoma macrolepis]XP_058609763.1 uncharacterized protein LOC131525823 isoform X3 [Onychostoma macrolepis]XP_058609765.1 uncharacterized protein LOC131525823 isoform X3 [Onychostoma macrolepis]KAF4100966.1 hypothetical protein G5714_019162 [Onychostoma macrolepis]
MEKVMLFWVFSYRIIQISSSDVSEHDVTLRFRLNGNISLNCNTTNKIIMSWYHQNPDTGRLTLLIYTLYKNYKKYQNHRMRITGKVGTNTASLVITNLTESDSGLYFCGTCVSMYSEMYFNKPIRLVMEDKEDKVHSVTEPPEDVEITASTVAVMLTERVMVFGGVGLAVFVLFLATVIAGGIIHYYGWQKGWTAAKRAGLTD